MEPSFILALFRHGYKVRTSTLYHLLKGKRTSSVLLYGFLYESLQFFQLFPALSEKQFTTIIDDLIYDHLLQRTADGEVQITDKGLYYTVHKTTSYKWIDNYRFGKTDETIWHLLQFTVQIVSNLSYSNKNYIPLEQSPFYQNQVKKYIKSMPKAYLVEQVKKEWMMIFSNLSNADANFFVQQFSGYNQIGKAAFQLMEEQTTTFERFLLQKDKLHHLLDFIDQMPGNSFLKGFISPFLIQNANKSMQETSAYLRTPLSVEEIALQRGVQISTIKDHLMELSLTNDFPFERFITVETYQYLRNYISPYQNWVYRAMKQTLPELDYFEFRLYQIQKLKEERESTT
ncbi:hypothetical protein UAY_01607 [Enterococcus moraviensis ATCC BAA-383]|uniref:Helicase Helix-turn-helix domain-containing protein n=1 Tax=Enterococcus moraviensis ATCC BAA-383 TaxID=1158609 RepID=R2T688_9ENTE|nr:helix-turn-helix domain-containing protein [Enterococcus moraviensis]EOI00504.1 hypothetical protein UAY_01607 [Enterococcus moraviensis ATCC BAA-383]EOT73267.1 hypothetical protein I586_00260 [Enterococcus moraviensis ATCC BAA-383]OJG68822.1 hypothetical protein RV09_GL000221 [Enterococcus moraviensis]